MLKIIKSMSELNIEQILAVCAENFDAKSKRAQSEDDFLSYLREDFFCQRNAFYAVWVVDGCYRSVLRMEPYKEGFLLLGLETAPEDRKKGYAAALVTAALDYLRSDGCKRVYSHVAKRNQPSLKVHMNCGFQQISDSAVYIDGTVTQNSCTLCVKL